MDFSDQIRRMQTKAIWGNYRATALATQANCNFSTCASTLNNAGCKTNYTTYEYKNQVLTGKANCLNCSTVCGCGS